MRCTHVGCKFEGTRKEYTFACDIDVQVGDMVVVDTQNGFQVTKVTSINPKIDFNTDNLKAVVDKVDIAGYKEREEIRAKRNALKRKMDERVKELQDIAIYEMLSEKDPELASMLTELKSYSL